MKTGYGMGSYFIFLTTDFSRSDTEVVNRLRRKTKKIISNYISFSVFFRAFPW
jgi:hypothetical protein